MPPLRNLNLLGYWKRTVSLTLVAKTQQENSELERRLRLVQQAKFAAEEKLEEAKIAYQDSLLEVLLFFVCIVNEH